MRIPMIELLRRARWIVLIMLAVYLASFGAGYAAGKLKLSDPGRVRGSSLSEFNRNLEYRIPGYGPLLQKYKTWERRKMMDNISRGRAVSTMFIIFLNNWIVSDLTEIVRTAVIAPLALYPYSRFVQGLFFAQTRSGYQAWMIWLTEFGGYFVTICGALAVLLWTLFFRRFRFDSRKKAFFSGLKVFGLFYAVSGVCLFIGAYLEMMNWLGLMIR
jgi:hypothetical protein